MKQGSTAGDIESTTPVEVTITKGSTGSEKIPVNQIRSIIFSDEPNDLTQARVMIVDGRGYRDALDRLERIEPAEVTRDLNRDDIEFYRAVCAAKLALSGQGDLRQAGRDMSAFVNKHKNSYHYFEASEVLGDMLVAADSFRSAQRVYAELAKAPWPDYKARAAVLAGRALQRDNKHDEAIRQFDEAIRLAGSSDEAKPQRLAGTLGKAISLAASGEVNQAVTEIEDVIAQADPEDVELHALAYNALGRCYQQADKPKDALLAYLHVDVLYSAAADQHAEALTQLVTLWESIGQDSRAREAKQKLQENYGGG
jgi:tetratricopeptide (TPR) repeat protein